jgi:hypothetical protein
LINASTFYLHWYVDEDSEFFNEYHNHHCSLIFSAMLTAINVSFFGVFYWFDGTEIGPVFLRNDPSKDSDSLITLEQDHGQTFETLQSLSDPDVHRVIILFGALCRNGESVVVDEYLKGVMHIRMNYYDINFHREAFANFYRVIEYLVTNRILGKRKLKNELTEISKVLINFGADEQLCESFKEIYKRRGSQIMHAQLEPEPVKFEEVLIVKTVCDLLMTKHYNAVAEKWRVEKLSH